MEHDAEKLAFSGVLYRGCCARRGGRATDVPASCAISGTGKKTEALSIPTVAVIHPARETGVEDLILPGTLQAYVESPIYARTNGYLKKWCHDIGTRVKKGELLADIDTPEVDQQLMQAKADLVTAQANLHFHKSPQRATASC